jgi:ADP-ribose pyrophosphatase YjhB (NUDIX family)
VSSRVTVGNVCFIFNASKDKILLLKRKYLPMEELWTGVGGKTNYSEDITASCIREIREETSIEIQKVSLNKQY